MQRQRWLLFVIAALVGLALWAIAAIPPQLGLDLQGGTQLTIQVKTTPEIKQITDREMEAVQKVIEGRVNGLGVSEAVVQTVGQDQVLVQLPGVNDPEQAERVLGGTAQLDFRKQKPGTEQRLMIEQQVLQEKLLQQKALKKSPDTAAVTKNREELNAAIKAVAELYEKTDLTGKNLKDAYPEPSGAQNNWNVAIRFDETGGQKFAELTKNLAGTGRTLGIFLDDRLISSPSVGVEFAQTGITGGSAIIQGRFTAEESNELSVQLRGGSLPVPIQVVENRTVGATLGKDSIERSIYAAIGGLLLVLGFIVVYYRLPGIIAAIALVIYSILTYAGFKLLGVTLTLPGIAGFILSIGMAVDANVLIFERTREELRAGKTLYRSVESGFYRAFSSILDSNVTTLIACGALFWLGAGLVRGFALTLALGVVVSMFTAITCSRTLLMFAISFQQLRKPEYFCPNLSKTQPTTEAAS